MPKHQRYTNGHQETIKICLIIIIIIFFFRGTKESSIPAVSDPVGVSQSKRCFGSTLQSDSVTGVTETETIMIRNKQPDTLKNNNNNNKLGCDTSSNNNATGKVKGIHFKTGKESKSSVFDRLHKTPIRNMKANAKSDINLLAQIHEGNNGILFIL